MRLLLLLLVVYPLSAYAAIDPEKLASARHHFWNHRNAEAKAAFSAFAAEEPNNGEVTHRLGVLALREGKLEEAEALLLRAAEQDPQLDQQSEIFIHRGDLYAQQAMRAGLFSKLALAKKCKISYQKAVALDPSNIWAHLSLMEFYRHAPSIAGGSLQKARLHAEAAAGIDPAKGRFALALVSVSEKKIDEAFGLFREVAIDSSSDYVALSQLGQLCVITGQRLETGATAFRRCLDLTPVSGAPNHPTVHYLLGQIAEKKNDPVSAQAAYKAALQLDPNFGPARAALDQAPRPAPAQ